MSQPKLYVSAVSPTCKRVFATMLHKKVAYEHVEIDIAQKKRLDEFEKVSPHGKVPIMVHEGHVLHESTVINEYAEEVWPSVRMLPEEPWRRAHARAWIKYADNQLQDLDAKMVHKAQGRDAKQAICREILGNLAKLDAELADKDQLFLGAELSLVDTAIAPTLRLVPIWSKLIGDTSWEGYKNLKSYLDRLAEQPTLEKAVWDTPDEVYEGFFTAVLVEGLTFP